MGGVLLGEAACAKEIDFDTGVVPKGALVLNESLVWAPKLLLQCSVACTEKIP